MFQLFPSQVSSSVFGSNFGMSFPRNDPVAPPGVASALVNTTQQIGGSLGTAVLNTIYLNAVTAFIVANASNPRDPVALVHGYTTAFTWSAAVLALAAVLAFALVQNDKSQLASTDGAVAA